MPKPPKEDGGVFQCLITQTDSRMLHSFENRSIVHVVRYVDKYFLIFLSICQPFLFES